MSNKFKIGDLVRILNGSKIKNKSSILFWAADMNKMVGKFYYIEGIIDTNNYFISGYEFDENWLELAEPKVKPETKKGFDPENLTFDGVAIEEGDKVEIFINSKALNKHKIFKVESEDCGGDGVVIKPPNDKNLGIPLYMLNLVNHFPKLKKDLELEKLNEELQKSIDGLNTNEHLVDFSPALNHYYQARKNLENYKSTKN